MLTIACNSVSAVAALVAAYLWWKASRLTVSPDRRPNADGSYSASITYTDDSGREVDPFETAIQNGRLNAKAAMAAAIAALAQGAGLAFSLLQI